MNERRLSEIWIYPIKSLGGIRLASAKVSPKGLEYDRRWMLIDGNNVFMTQRIYPTMALFSVSIEAGKIIVTHRTGNSSTSFEIDEAIDEPKIRSQVWDDEVEVIEVSRSVSKWFTEQMGMTCKLVAFPEDHHRAIDPDFRLNETDQVSLADAYPFLIIGEASLNDLNRRLSHAVPMNRFRPNFVFSGGAPFEEDSWRRFSIGGTEFAGVKPCARCVLTTVDQVTAAKGTEPLATLAKFRKRDNKIYFGQNVIAISHQSVHVGDAINVHTLSGT